MEHYDLRNCFLPDLSGLHVRIFQFKELLKQHLPALWDHLELLQIECAYVSQWFLSFFAVTCPLPMLFRIYDVIFAEGASETIMRVALSLMRKNEEKILACSEFEDVMQLLLSRGLWDCYGYNADDFVNDFASLTVVTNESLQALETKYRETQANEARSSDLQSTASRFLGRLWAGSSSTKSTSTLSPGLAAASRPVSFLRRSPSKQSIASTLNSVEGGADSIASSASTEATTVSRDSSNADGASLKSRGESVFSAVVVPVRKPMTSRDKDLHVQIEELLTALSELQRDNALLATQLQKQREEREEDGNAVRSLLDVLRKTTGSETMNTVESDNSEDTVTPSDYEGSPTNETDLSEEEATPEDSESDSESIKLPDIERTTTPSTDQALDSGKLNDLIDSLSDRFSTIHDNRRTSLVQTKHQMRDELVRIREHLSTEVSKSQDLARRMSEQEQETANLRDQVREGHTHIRTAHQDKQRLEKIINELRRCNKQSSTASPVEGGISAAESEWPSRASTVGGLRELKLGRANSTRNPGPVFSKRSSSLSTQSMLSMRETESMSEPVSLDHAVTPPAADNDALLLELVQAKTAEAVARQDAEEAKAKLEGLRKMLGVSGASMAPPGLAAELPRPAIERSATMANLGGYLGRASVPEVNVVTPPAVSAPASGGGGFWGGWGKRSVSMDRTGQ